MVDPRLKVGWAKRHLDSLNKSIAEFVNLNAYRISTHDDVESGHYVFDIRTAPLWPQHGLMLGDFVACLRGSLDHLAGQLTLLPRGTRNDLAAFPVIEKWNADGRDRFKRWTKGIPSDALSVIELLQPYHCPNGFESSQLWKLDRLWNIDKHRRIPFHPSATTFDVGSFGQHQPIVERTDYGGTVRFPLAAKPYIQFKPAMSIDVYFGDESEGIIVTPADLTDIYEFVCRDVLPRFAGFFEE